MLNIVVGLGNPGHTYHGTRHNIGFAVVQLLADRYKVSLTQQLVNPTDQRPACVYGDVNMGGRILRLLMPLTMMNESGEALRAVDIEPQRLLILCDDVNLSLGALRVRSQGSAGGHHGLQSCLDVLGTDHVPRLRIGVGVSPLPEDLTQFVLSPFTSAERLVMTRALEQAAEACEVWAREGIDAAMNRYNRAE